MTYNVAPKSKAKMVADILPERIRQMIDLLAAVIRRIDTSKLDKAPHKSLCMKTIERSYV